MDINHVTNAPVCIMVLDVADGAVTREKKVHARARKLREAIEWNTEAAQHEAAIESGGVEALVAAAEFIAEYSPQWNDAIREAIRNDATGPQIVEALLTLREMNDPLAAKRRRLEAKQDRDVRMLETITRIDSGAINDLVGKHVAAAKAEAAQADAARRDNATARDNSHGT